MRRLLLYFFSFYLLVLGQNSLAQSDSTKTQSDSSRLEVKSGLQVYVDYGKILTLFTEFESKLEAGVAYQLKNRFSPNFQIGQSTLEPSVAFENGEYKSEGIYARVGIDYTLPFDATNLFYVGLKYGFSSFSESLTYTISTSLWPDPAQPFENDDATASWTELVIGSEKKMQNSNWRIGGYFALRVLIDRDTFDPIDTFTIPGYGRTADDTVPAINLYVKYAF